MEPRLRVHLLGAPEATLDGQPVAGLKLRKTQALLYLLAAHAGPQRRTILTGLLWGDLPEAAASTNLRKSLFKLRHALDPFLDIERETVALRREPAVWVDHAEFVARNNAPGASGVAQLEAAAGLYRGDFLAGFYVHDAPDFEHWVTAERARVRELALAALHTLSGAYAEAGDLAHAIAHTRRALALEPWCEEAHIDLMRLLARAGQRSAALAQYEICRQALAEELDVAPGPETEQVLASIRDGTLAGAALRPGSAAAPVILAPGKPQGTRPPDNLPAQATPCVGRSREIGQVAGLLADPAVRLVTLTGAGGMGKTRLALAVAQQLLDDSSTPTAAVAPGTGVPPFADGIFFVPLAPLAAAAQLVPTTAAALAFRPAAGDGSRDAAAQLRDYLAGKRMLLVLDNFEHLAAEGAAEDGTGDGAAGEGAAWLAELLAAAPGVKALVTSREPLELPAEQRYPIGGLAVPDLEAVLPDQPLDGENALTLFLQVARRVEYSFRLTAANTLDVGRICRLVGGMPLAIQLAASWVALLSPAEIAAEIAADLHFLNTTRRDLPERHRSVAAVIEPSWRRLNPAEQDAFMRLCVCRGGFTRVDAQALTGCGLATLARLQQHAFLQYASESGRYQVHEVLRQYGAVQLAADPARQADAQRSHGRHYSAWLAGHSGRINTAEQVRVLAALDAEVDNCRAAWAWAAAAGDRAALAAAADPLFFYCEYRGRFQEGFDACRIAVEQGVGGATTEDERWRAHLWAWQGAFGHSLGQFEEPHRLLASSLAQLEELSGQGRDVRSELAFTRLCVGKLASWRKPAEARAHHEASQRLYRSIGDSWGAARALENLGLASMLDLGGGAGEDCYRQAIALLGTIGDPRIRARLRYRLALALAFQGRRDEAEGYIRESLALARSLDDRSVVARVLAERAAAGCFLGSFAEALGWGQESLALYQYLSDRLQLINTSLIVATILLHLGDWDGCRAHAEQTAALLAWNQDSGYVLWAHSLLSAAALANGSHDLALQHGLEAMLMARRTEFRLFNSLNLSTAGLAAMRSGDQDRARQYLLDNLLCVESGATHQETLIALLCAAFFLAQQGDVITAGRVYVQIRQQPSIANSVFCQVVAGRELEALLARLTPEQLAAVQATANPFDPQSLATALRAAL
jgi:DNA-binding SARP family transcriptional activator/predicted ATPase